MYDGEYGTRPSEFRPIADLAGGGVMTNGDAQTIFGDAVA